MLNVSRSSMINILILVIWMLVENNLPTLRIRSFHIAKMARENNIRYRFRLGGSSPKDILRGSKRVSLKGVVSVQSRLFRPQDVGFHNKLHLPRRDKEAGEFLLPFLSSIPFLISNCVISALLNCTSCQSGGGWFLERVGIISFNCAYSNMSFIRTIRDKASPFTWGMLVPYYFMYVM